MKRQLCIYAVPDLQYICTC